MVIVWAAPSLFCCKPSLMAFPWSFCVKTNVRTWLSCLTPADTGISWISDSWSQHGVQAADSRHTFSPGHLHFQSHPGHHRSAANLMFCLGFFFSCPLRACLNSWRWWMRVKNTLQVGFGYNLSWEGGEDEGIRGGIEGGMVYRWALGGLARWEPGCLSSNEPWLWEKEEGRVGWEERGGWQEKKGGRASPCREGIMF